MSSGNLIMQPFLKGFDSIPEVVNASENDCCHRLAIQIKLMNGIARAVLEMENMDGFLGQACRLIFQALDYDLAQVWSVGSSLEDLILTGEAWRRRGGSVSRQTGPPDSRKSRWQDLMSGCDDVSLIVVIPADLSNPVSRISVPLKLRGRIVGFLYLEQSGLRSLSDEDTVMLEDISVMLSIVFEKARILMHGEQTNDYMKSLLNAAQEVAILATDVQGYILQASEGAQSIFRITPQELVGKDVLGLFSDTAFQQEVAEHLGSFAATPLKRNRLPQTSQGIESYLHVTIQQTCDSQKRPFGQLFVLTDVTQSVLQQKHLEELAMTDDLTGLYNQRRFLADLTSEVERNRRFGRTCSLGFIDVDKLRSANDARGHLAGDQILREVAGLISLQTQTKSGSCYRYGGDEFTILLPETTKLAAKALLDEVREQIKEHFCGEITASVGIAEWSAVIGYQELIEAADRAMYIAKSHGGDWTELANS
jgi:diguanylate cyclase (GGDEF)-like protein